MKIWDISNESISQEDHTSPIIDPIKEIELTIVNTKYPGVKVNYPVGLDSKKINTVNKKLLEFSKRNLKVNSFTGISGTVLNRVDIRKYIKLPASLNVAVSSESESNINISFIISFKLNGHKDVDDLKGYAKFNITYDQFGNIKSYELISKEEAKKSNELFDILEDFSNALSSESFIFNEVDNVDYEVESIKTRIGLWYEAAKKTGALWRIKSDSRVRKTLEKDLESIRNMTEEEWNKAADTPLKFRFFRPSEIKMLERSVRDVLHVLDPYMNDLKNATKLFAGRKLFGHRSNMIISLQNTIFKLAKSYEKVNDKIIKHEEEIAKIRLRPVDNKATLKSLGFSRDSIIDILSMWLKDSSGNFNKFNDLVNLMLEVNRKWPEVAQQIDKMSNNVGNISVKANQGAKTEVSYTAEHHRSVTSSLYRINRTLLETKELYSLVDSSMFRLCNKITPWSFKDLLLF